VKNTKIPLQQYLVSCGNEKIWRNKLKIYN